MSLKIIVNDGRCRGRPPTKGLNRDGPEPVVSRQSLVASQVGEKPAADSRPLTADQELLVSLRDLSALVVKRRWGEEELVKRRNREDFRFRIAEFIFQKSEFRNRKSKIKGSLARDWVTHTCSEGQNIKKNRDNDRWGATFNLPENGETGELCLVANRKKPEKNIYGSD